MEEKNVNQEKQNEMAEALTKEPSLYKRKKISENEEKKTKENQNSEDQSKHWENEEDKHFNRQNIEEETEESAFSQYVSRFYQRKNSWKPIELEWNYKLIEQPKQQIFEAA